MAPNPKALHMAWKAAVHLPADHIQINKDVVEYIQSCMDCGRTVTLEDLKFIFHKRVDAKQIKNSNEHNALTDARWNFELYKFLQKL